MAEELAQKLARLRRLLAATDMDAVLLTQAGNLSWIMCGGDALVSLTDAPVAQVLVGRDDVRVLLPEFERDRLEAEELPAEFQPVYLPWEDPSAGEAARNAFAAAERTLSDAPIPGTVPHDFWGLRAPLHQAEIERYRTLGADAARAVGSVVRALEPGLVEHEIAARVAFELRRMAIQPALILVAGDARLKRFRHPLPKAEQVNDRLMVVVCARRHGLYANLTRLAAFTPLEPQEERRYASLLEVEAAAFALTRNGRAYREILAAVADAYSDQGHPLAWKHHHQGGPTGYNSRDFFATMAEERAVVDGSAHAWNPSLPGLKVEDTVLLHGNRLEVLTVDPEWPTLEVAGCDRPQVLVLP